MSGIRQGYRGWVAFTPTAASPIYVLCRLPGAQLAMPRNLDTLYPASNQPFGEINLADGLQFPTLNMPLVPMTGMATPWWTAAILNSWFKTRTNDDLSAIGNGGIDFADSSDAAGTGRFRCLNPKGCQFTLASSFQEPLQFNGLFMGTDLDPTNPAAAPSSGLVGTQLMFNACTFTGALSGTKITGFSLMYTANATPSPELSGTLRPIEINAGLPQGTLMLQTNGGVPLADGSVGAIVAGGITFTMNNLVCLNPNDRQQQVGRVMRVFNYKCYGTTSAEPVVIS